MDIFGLSAHILVNGRKVKEYRHNGLTFIEAKDGTEFTIEVKNHTGQRVLAIVSVDGLDIIDGKAATGSSRGYIINPASGDTFSGWRRTKDEVASFKFTTKEKSYATEKGEGQNNGVIAVKFIAEKVKTALFPSYNWTPPPRPRTPYVPHTPYVPDPIYVSGNGNPVDWGNGVRYGGGTTTSSSPLRSRVLYNAEAVYVAPTAAMDTQFTADFSVRSLNNVETQAATYSVQSEQPEAQFDMGTTWGSVKQESVTETEFEYGQELGTLEFFYASRDALKAMGIPLVNIREVPLPKAFKSGTYAQPPKNWRG